MQPQSARIMSIGSLDHAEIGQGSGLYLEHSYHSAGLQIKLKKGILLKLKTFF